MYQPEGKQDFDLFIAKTSNTSALFYNC